MLSSERWQPERIAAILDPEYAQQEAVHAKYHTSPDEDSNLLLSWISHPWDLQGEADRGE